MQGISDTTPQTGYAARLRKRLLAVASIAAVAGLSLVSAVPVQAAAAITVTALGDPTKAHHMEGVQYSLGIPSANDTVEFNFTDAAACTVPGDPSSCNAGTVYSVNIGWGDNTAHSISTSFAQFRTQDAGNQATYDIVAPHSYGDEFNDGNAQSLTGYPLFVQVTNTSNSTSSANTGTPYIAVQDQPSQGAGTAQPISAIAGTPFSGIIGSFHDNNYQANLLDQDGVTPEYHMTIKWGDGTSNSSGSLTIGTCGASSGPAPLGCPVTVNGTHTWTKFGRYTINVTINDGATGPNHSAMFTSTANVYAPGELQLSPTGIGFGNELLGTTSAPQTFTVSNPGTSNVTVTASMSSGDTTQFGVANNTCASVTLPSLGTCTVDFTFKPTTGGDKQARFNVTSAQFGTLALVLSGTGVGPTCASTSITPDVTSPQNVGTPVTLNATQAGCPHASPLYRFYIRTTDKVWHVVRDFQAGNSYLWDTSTYKPGTYLIGVWLKDAQSTKSYDAYAFGTFTLEIPYCTSTNVTGDLASPQSSGTTVNFTATNDAGCPNPLFQWWVRDAAGDWNIVPGHDFAHSSNTFAWNTTGLSNGTYQVGAWIKQIGSSKSYDAYSFLTYTLTPTPITGTTLCKAVTVTDNVASPSETGTTVTFTATAFGCDNPQYRWWVRDAAGVWNVVPGHDYGAGTNTYAWSTGSLPAGTYQVGVWVRQTGSSASYEAYNFITYTLTAAAADQVCSSVGLTPDLSSPRASGTPINFTAVANGCGAPTYQFFVAPPYGAFAIQQPYSLTDTFPWTTTGLIAGPYQIGVWARHSGASVSYEAFAIITFQLTGTQCTSVTVETSPGLIVSRGATTINFTATGNGCADPLYKFYLRTGSGAYHAVTSYGLSNSYTLHLNTAATGPWSMIVLAEDATSPGAFDAFAGTDFRVI